MIGICKEDQLGKIGKQRTKKRTNKANNPYFIWSREEIPECIICGDLGEIHHLEQGYKADDTRIIMLCVNHHSQQSMDGIHHGMEDWYKRFLSFDECEEIAEANYGVFSETRQE